MAFLIVLVCFILLLPNLDVEKRKRDMGMAAAGGNHESGSIACTCRRVKNLDRLDEI